MSRGNGCCKFKGMMCLVCHRVGYRYWRTKYKSVWALSKHLSEDHGIDWFKKERHRKQLEYFRIYNKGRII